MVPASGFNADLRPRNPKNAGVQVKTRLVAGPGILDDLSFPGKGGSDQGTAPWQKIAGGGESTR
jgi:hypothetical protein